MWVDIVKGVVIALVTIAILSAIYFSTSTVSFSNIGLLLFLIIIEAVLLFWFVFRGNGKKIKVNPFHFLLGAIIGCALSLFLVLAYCKF